MPKRRLRVVVVAEESAGVHVLHSLRGLMTSPEIVTVLTTHASTRKRRPLVHEAARQLGLETQPAGLVRSPDLAERLRSLKIDLLLNVHSLFLVHPDVLAAPRIGSFNLHPGPLPEYAGLNVPSWAVYNGEDAHGVAVHWMDEGIDTGPVAWRHRFALEETDTGLSVSGKCIRHGVPLLMALIDAAAGASVIPRLEQDRSRRRYFPAGPPAEGRLTWSAPAAAILRFVRACDYGPFTSPWGHPQAVIGGRRVGLVRATATGTPATEPPGTLHAVTDSGVLVASGDELVAVQRISVDGRNLSATQFLAD
jgi:methionyl-tRNA formyltransferase